jgi:uncharacterized membrane protein
MTSATAPLRASLLRSAALGAASGCRSTAGATAVVLTARPTDPGPAARAGRGRLLALVLAAAELVADKLPVTPPRTQPAGLPRLAAGAGSATAVAQRDGRAPAAAAAVGTLAAAAAAELASRARAVAARRLGSDLPGALLEDVLAALLAWWGTRRPAPGAGRPVAEHGDRAGS